MGWTRTKTEVEKAEEKLDSCLESVGIGAGLTVGQSKEFAEAVKSYVRALVEQEKDDLRDEINRTGNWSPDY